MLGPTKELEGVLLIDKPLGLTSHDVVYRVRRKLQMKRIGHAGTLDPLATGLLIILVGKATKASQFLMTQDKEYTGSVELGKVTNTQDGEGEILETRPVPDTINDAAIRAAMQAMLGDQYQIPPMFSAIKKDGVALYKLAREGEEVEREPRFIRVMSFELTGSALPSFDFRVRCTKGTYVRTLAHDIGARLGTGGYLTALRRTSSEHLNLSQAVTLDALETMTLAEVEARLLPVHQVVPAGFAR